MSADRRSRWRAESHRRLDPIVESLVDAAEAPARATLSAFRFSDCAARALADEPFHWAPHSVARTLAGHALAGDDTPLEAVREAIDLLGGADTGDSLGDYLRALSPGARTQVVRTSVALATAVRASMNPRTVKFRRTTYQVPFGPILLSATSDLDRHRDGSVTVGLMNVRSEHADDELGYLALLATVNGPAQLRDVVGFDPRRGQWERRDITDNLLAAALDRVAERVGEWVGQFLGVPPSPTPGASCGWCSRLDECPAGRAFLDDPTRAIGGLPRDR